MFYYIKKAGTATGTNGKSASLRTGTWNSDPTTYYDSLKAALTASAPSTDDVFLFSHLHLHDNSTGAEDYNMSVNVTFLSVDDANQDQYKRGAIERNSYTNATMYLFNSTGKRLYCKGVSFESDYRINTGKSNSANIFYFRDCGLKIIGSNVNGYIGGLSGWPFGALYYFDVVDVEFGGDLQGLSLDEQCGLYMRGGSISGTKFVAKTQSFQDGGWGHFEYVDCTGMTATTTGENPLSHGASNINRSARMSMYRCKLPETESFIIALSSMNQGVSIKIDSCSIDNGASAGDHDAYWYQLHQDKAGRLETVTSPTRNGTYDGSTKFCFSIDTASDINQVHPARFKIAALPVQDHTSAITYTVHFDSPTSGLTDADCWIEVVRSHVAGTAALSYHNLGVIQSGESADTIELGGGSAHTAGSGWTGGTNAYKQSITVAADALQLDNDVVEVWFCARKASTTFNVDAEIEIT